VIFGAMIILFMIYQPLGMAKIFQNFQDRLRKWPFKT